VLYGNNTLMLKYEVRVEVGALESEDEILELKDVIKHVIDIDSSELGKIQEFEREAEKKEKELEEKALVLKQMIQELKGKEYRFLSKCEDDDDCW
jgi:hypothetical protein